MDMWDLSLMARLETAVMQLNVLQVASYTLKPREGN